MKRIVAFITILALIFCMMIPSVWAEGEILEAMDTDITEVSITVTYDQTGARGMLEMINQFRSSSDAWLYNKSGTKETVTGLSPLKYDYTLEQIAMQRAGELAIRYSHTRPDGSNCFTAFPLETNYSRKGENVSAGIQSAEQTFKDWREDNAADYNGQGHRRSMLSGEFNAVGIAHVRFNGLDYWIQEFGKTEEPNEDSSNPVNGEAMIKINVKNSDAEVSEIKIPQKITLREGETQTVPFATATMKLQETWPEMTFKATVFPSWLSEDSGILTSENDQLTGITQGSTTLRANALGKDLTIPVRIVDKDGIPLMGITITGDDRIQEKHTARLKVNYDPENTTDDRTVKWSSSNENVAAVNQDGYVTAKSVGNAVITAECDSYKAEFKLTVTEDPDATCPSNRFGDLNKALWYHEGVDYVLRNGYMTGTGQYSFEPNGMVTRGQIVTILYAMNGKPYVLWPNTFKDVKRSDWYYTPVAWASANGIVAGYGDGLFGPEDNVTREQLVAILYQYTKLCKYELTMQETSLEGFKDYLSISNYAVVPMLWAVSNGIISGTDKGLEPTAQATRAQVAAMIRAYCINVAGK